MRRYTIAVIAAVSTVAFVQIASAADLPRKAPPKPLPPPPPLFTWTGCYIGGHVGGGWAHRDAFENTIALGFDAGPGSVELEGSGVVGGVHAGCNYQFAANWVIGFEGDWSAANIDDTQSAPNTYLDGSPVGSGSIDFSHDIKWLASFRGRLGFAVVPNVLLYGTGGVAWARSDLTGLHTYITPCPNCSLTNVETTSTGWVAGLGVDWAPWNNNWIFGVEYLHYDLGGTDSLGLHQSSGVATTNLDWDRLKVDVVRARVSFKFF